MAKLCVGLHQEFTSQCSRIVAVGRFFPPAAIKVTL